MALNYPTSFVTMVYQSYGGTAAPDLARENQFSLGAILCEGAGESDERRSVYMEWLRIIVSEAERVPASRRSWKPPVKAGVGIHFPNDVEVAEVWTSRG